VGAQNAFAHGQVDQSFIGPFIGSQALNPVTADSQGFTPIAFDLVGVDIFITGSISPPSPLGFSDTVIVNILSGGNIVGTSSKTVTLTSSGGSLINPQVEHFDFFPSVQLTGGPFEIQVQTTTSTNDLRWITSSGNPYSGGIAVFNDIPSPDFDLGFRTYFSESVVGGEFLPIDSTALLLAGLQTSAIWMLPVLVGAAGAGFAAFKLRRK